MKTTDLLPASPIELLTAAPIPYNYPAGRAPLTGCYYMGDYEKNGYHDSYFSVVFWNDNTGEIITTEYAATAYGGGWDWQKELIRGFPAAVLARLNAHRYALTLASLTGQEKDRVLVPTPEEMPFASTVRLLKSSRKGCATPYTAGEIGEVFGHYWFGTFYGNGYNTRGRSNGRAGLRMADGRMVYVAMTVCRLNEEPDLARVERDARAVVAGPFVCPGAWWSNVASNVASD